MKTHLALLHVETDLCENFIRIPFDVTVNLSTMESNDKGMACCLKKATRESIDFVLELVSEPMHAALSCGNCVDNKDGTFTMSRVYLMVTRQALASKINPEVCKLWDICLTERQCAGITLYYDVFSKMFYLHQIGVTICALPLNIARTMMCFFAYLVKDPSADDVYKTRYIALHGGSSADKKCSVCEKVGDFRECQRCKAGIYICSPVCQHSLHLDICNALVETPVDKRACQNFQSLQLAQEINMFTTMPIEVFDGHYCKPTLSRICEVCGAVAKHKCNTCKKVYYCSKTCQTLAFPVHKRLHHV
jgi:hypothetical protein